MKWVVETERESRGERALAVASYKIIFHLLFCPCCRCCCVWSRVACETGKNELYLICIQFFFRHRCRQRRLNTVKWTQLMFFVVVFFLFLSPGCVIVGGGVECLSFRALRSVLRAKRTRPMNVLELLARYYITQSTRRWKRSKADCSWDFRLSLRVTHSTAIIVCSFNKSRAFA